MLISIFAVSLLSLPEIKREEILAQRQDELQKIKDRKALDALLAAQQGGDVSAAAKRALSWSSALIFVSPLHQVRTKLEVRPRRRRANLTSSRRSVGRKVRRRRYCSSSVATRRLTIAQTKASSPKRERSASPTDMEMSSEDEEDGQISKREQKEERESRLINKEKPSQEELISTMSQLEMLRLPRSQLAKYARMPWFEEYAKGEACSFLASPFVDNFGRRMGAIPHR